MSFLLKNVAVPSSGLSQSRFLLVQDEPAPYGFRAFEYKNSGRN